MILRRSRPQPLSWEYKHSHTPLTSTLSTTFHQREGSAQQDRGAIFGAMHAHCTRTCTPTLVLPDKHMHTHTHHTHRVICRHAYFASAAARYCSSLQQDGRLNQSQRNQWKIEVKLKRKKIKHSSSTREWHSQALITFPWMSKITWCPRFLHGDSLLSVGNSELWWVEPWKVRHIYCRGVIDVTAFLWMDVLFAYVFLYCMYFSETTLWYSLIQLSMRCVLCLISISA